MNKKTSCTPKQALRLGLRLGILKGLFEKKKRERDFFLSSLKWDGWIWRQMLGPLIQETKNEMAGCPQGQDLPRSADPTREKLPVNLKVAMKWVESHSVSKKQWPHPFLNRAQWMFQQLANKICNFSLEKEIECGIVEQGHYFFYGER